MISITDKHDCSGCGACAQACPKGCITMREDGEGFLYPEVDKAKCVDCGLCERVCPLLKQAEQREPLQVLGVKNRDRQDRMASSSGGVFIALARRTIACGGVVFGTVFDDDWQVRHTSADTLGGVRAMMGSKYVQSRIGETYREAAACLKAGRKVMFVGTPCQTAGLRSYLRKDYEGLLAVDILCHGVPSPAVWRSYLKETFECKDGCTKITSVCFRDKQKEGWARYNVVVRGVTAGGEGAERELSAAVYVDNPFMKGFMADAYLRPSCHRCRCKHGASGSDLIIADYWGARFAVPDFADDSGVSLVLVNTDKGREALAGLDVDTLPTTVKGEERYNGGFDSAGPERPCRRKFFDSMASGAGFHASLERALSVPPYLILYKKITKTVRNIIFRFVK